MFFSSKRRIGGAASDLSRSYKGKPSSNSTPTPKKRKFNNIGGIIATDALNRQRFGLAAPKKRKVTKKRPASKGKKRAKKRVVKRKGQKGAKRSPLAKKRSGTKSRRKANKGVKRKTRGKKTSKKAKGRKTKKGKKSAKASKLGIESVLQ